MGEEKKLSEAGKELALLGASKGGKARAEKLTKDERQAIARHAAESRWGKSRSILPKATHAGILKIGDLELPCFVLQDGTRVLSGRGMTKAIGMKGRGQGVERISSHKTLIPFIINGLDVAIQKPIRFVGVGSRTTNPTAGYEATILLQLCEAILKARDEGVLKTEQEKRYARQCDMLIRAFAKIGIIALVDEATGYQYDRARDELNVILQAYIAKELLPWTKRFPDEFFKQIYRLNHWEYREGNHKRPQVVGKLINKLIYEPLPPGVLTELRRLNPKTEKGYRKHKFFQFLTSETGHPHLDKQIIEVVTLMRISDDSGQFKQLFEKAFPKRKEPSAQLSFLDD